MQNLKEAANFLREKDFFCFLCHKNLDGDTVGAALALFYALKQLGKKAIIKTVNDEFLEKFGFLYPLKEEKEDLFKICHYVAVDVADTKLLGENFKYKIDLVIDHHFSNKLDCKIKCIDANKAATCEIIYYILKELNLKITKQIANCLYVGILTDSGCFKFENTTANTHKIAADLIEKGADFANINFRMFNCKTKERLQLEKEILENLEYFFNDRCVIVFITKEIIKKTKVSEEDCGSIADIAASFKDSVIAITAKQDEDLFKLSVRTKYDFDASLFCKSFKGGGHKKAAGCVVKGTEEEVKRIILKKIEEVFSF